MRVLILLSVSLLLWPAAPLQSQNPGDAQAEQGDWDRTQGIMNCAPRLVERRDLVEDNFEHSYVTNNPRDIEVGYFSVEPITYVEKGSRFCEALLPASGVSHTYFRASYLTTYVLPGSGVYALDLSSRAVIFNNALRIINSQNTIAAIEASHRLEIHGEGSDHFEELEEATFIDNEAYTWELEISEDGHWHGELSAGESFLLSDADVPAGYSVLGMNKRVRGPGQVTIRESVIFRVNSVSAFKYDPIFQAVCLFSLEALSISAHLLPCEE